MELAIAFDTHAYVKRLKSVGFTEEQAEVLASTQADLIEKRLATKKDIIELKREIAELRNELKRDIEESRAELKRDIVELRNELKKDIKELELNSDAKMSAQKVDLIKWVVGIAFAQATLIIALIKFL